MASDGVMQMPLGDLRILPSGGEPAGDPYALLSTVAASGNEDQA